RRERRNEMGKLEGKIAVVTGGNSGIGLATAQRFVEEGEYVFMKAIGKNVTAVESNVSNWPIWIVCMRRSGKRRAALILFSRTRAPASSRLLARSPRSTTTRFSTRT